MSSHTTESVVRNVLFGVTTWVLPLGLGIVATPIIVKTLGDDDYGIYALVLGFIGYSFNLNIGRAITKYLAEYREEERFDEINDVISATLILNLIIGVVGTLLIVFSAEWLVRSVFGIEGAAAGKAVMAFYLASFVIFLSMISQVFSSVIQGLQRFDVYAKLFNLNSIGLVAGNLALALMGYGLNTLLAWNLFISVITLTLGAVVSYSLYPQFRFKWIRGSETLTKVLRFSSGVIGYQILSNCLLLFERGWITRQLGSETLTLYVVPMMLGIYLHGFISSLLLVLFPLSSSIKEDTERLKRLYTKATKAICVPAVFLGCSLIALSHSFLSLWMGADFADKTWLLLVIHTLTFGLLAIQVVSWQMTEGRGESVYNFKVFSVCFVIMIGLVFALTSRYGETGIAVARLIGFATIFISVFYVEKWFFGSVLLKFWVGTFIRLGLAALSAAAAEYYVIRGVGLGWIGFFGAATTGAIIFGTVILLSGYFSKSDRELLMGLVRR